MRKYVVYQDLPVPDSKEVKRVYLKEGDEFTEDKAKAKEYRVRMILEIVKIILDIILRFGVRNNLKYEMK